MAPARRRTDPNHEKELLDQVLLLSMRPFLARCAEALLPRMELGEWLQPRCPLCGGEPEFAYINPKAERLLICSRCTGQWRYDPITCPYCENSDRSRITSFTSRDQRYRLYACDVCHRYLKAYDGRNASRPVMVAVDTIATLPLDAAAMQRPQMSRRSAFGVTKAKSGSHPQNGQWPCRQPENSGRCESASAHRARNGLRASTST